MVFSTVKVQLTKVRRGKVNLLIYANFETAEQPVGSQRKNSKGSIAEENALTTRLACRIYKRSASRSYLLVHS